MIECVDMLSWALAACFIGVFGVAIGALALYLTRPIRTLGLD
jgi:hypothetical protein